MGRKIVSEVKETRFSERFTLTRYEFVLESCTIGKFNLLSIIRYDNDGTPQNDVPSETNISSNRQVIQFQQTRDRLESFLERRYFFERISEFDDGRRLEHSFRVHSELTVFELVEVGSDQEQVGARFDGEETRSGNVDTVSVFKVCDYRRSCEYHPVTNKLRRPEYSRLIAAPTAVSS